MLRDLLGHKTTAMADRYIRHAGAAVHEAQEHIGAAIDAQLRGAGSRPEAGPDTAEAHTAKAPGFEGVD